jgi:hypothetical protein
MEIKEGRSAEGWKNINISWFTPYSHLRSLMNALSSNNEMNINILTASYYLSLY